MTLAHPSRRPVARRSSRAASGFPGPPRRCWWCSTRRRGRTFRAAGRSSDLSTPEASFADAVTGFIVPTELRLAFVECESGRGEVEAEDKIVGVSHGEGHVRL